MEELLKLQKPRLPNKDAHPYHMYDMITDTPAALRRVYQEEQAVIESVATVLHSDRINRILLVGIGTSWHATLNAAYLLNKVGGLGLSDTKTVTAWNSFDFIQQQPKIDSSSAVIIFSHRGVKKFSYQSYIRAKEAGSYTILLTGVGSALIESLDAVIRTSKQEQSSAFTISHSCSYYVSLILSVEIGLKNGVDTAKDLKQNHLAKVPEYFESLLQDETPYKRWAESAKDRSYLPFVGYLGNVSNCYEVALKIKEAAWVVAEGCQLEQFIHGPFVAVDNKTALTTIITPDPLGKERSHQLLNAAKHVGSVISAITTKSDTTTESIVGVENTIKLVDVPDPISIITNLGCLQLLTYHLALAKKTNPDTFRRDQPLHSDAFTTAGLLI
ncbi:hypothetical protein PPL_06466 [Heterostelium album PN500]|uniref:SIS domain-containing protein n=1 Tax=Heterostelium pallidum (strain ATCC 26659 / Pp 5 / PN500) TaxID=670386 RepID=D3BD85_HETP5|nr:hypothetical protein PPL_06466 [Heterostelium album PN500]EFA80877.1 hypothetical protein PPL_06466 [Heterostelium album PN500]|eukprot:XP_020432996.1 hypothetical protein PPL_06466 [Heterostelium album PN500]